MKRAVRKAIQNQEVVSAANFQRVVEDRDHYQELWRKQLDERAELAKVHSHVEMSGGGHPVDLKPGRAVFFCKSCHYQWPCDTFRRATGRNWKLLETPELRVEETDAE